MIIHRRATWDLGPTSQSPHAAIALPGWRGLATPGLTTLLSLRREIIMSRRTLLSLTASAIIGLGVAGTISTDASAYRAGVSRGGVYRGGYYRGGYYRGVRPGVALGIGAAAVGAAAIGAAATSAATPVGCPYGYYYYSPYNRCVPTP